MVDSILVLVVVVMAVGVPVLALTAVLLAAGLEVLEEVETARAETDSTDG